MNEISDCMCQSMKDVWHNLTVNDSSKCEDMQIPTKQWRFVEVLKRSIFYNKSLTVKHKRWILYPTCLVS